MQKFFANILLGVFFIFSLVCHGKTAQASTSLKLFVEEYQMFMCKEGYISYSTDQEKSQKKQNGTFSSLIPITSERAQVTQKTNIEDAILSRKAINDNNLSKLEAQRITEELLAIRKQSILHASGREWDARKLSYKGYTMPFYFKIFGKAPASGRSMYISMHGGGGTEAYINDQQWENQKKLYNLSEGLYFVPRAPTNTWNMWHQDYMDPFIQQAIELAVIKEGVNPNKVYIMGYSAGGDGVFQLATRMPDLFAGAAMSAGHPGDAHIENLLNLPFGLYMGGKDSAYKRNTLAQTWKNAFAKLAQNSQGAYVHDVHIFPQFGHWMEGKDSISIPFMSQYIRNPIPYEVYWIQDDVLRDHFYWISCAPKNKYKNGTIKVFYSDDDSLFYIKNETNVKNFIININDSMCDLDKKIKIYRKDRIIFEGIIPRSKDNIKKDIADGRDADLIFPAKILIEGMKAKVLGL